MNTSIKTTLLCTLVALGALTLVACGKKAELQLATHDAVAPSSNISMGASSAKMAASAGAAAAAKGEAAPAAALSSLEGSAKVTPVQQLSSSALTATPQGRQLVRTANLRAGVKDVYQASMAIEDAVSQHGGFVASNNTSQDVQQQQMFPAEDGKQLVLTHYVVSGELQLRVPSNNTQAFLRDIAKNLETLDSRNFTAEDVQFQQLRHQLEVQLQQEAQAQFAALTKQPGWVGERGAVVQMSSEAKAARNEAFVAQKELLDRVAFSTITVSLYQPALVKQQLLTDFQAVAQAHRPSFFTRLGQAVSSGWRSLLDLLVGLVRTWPVWLILSGFVWVIWRFDLLRIFRKSKSSQVEVQAAL